MMPCLSDSSTMPVTNGLGLPYNSGSTISAHRSPNTSFILGEYYVVYTQTRQPRFGSLRHRIRLHGHEPVVRTGGRDGIHRDPASFHRARLHLLGYGGSLWPLQ